MSESEHELVKQAREGDNAAFEKIVKKYESQIAATVFGMLGNCQAADDVGQEVFVRFFKYMNSFREDAALGTYLTRIAINLSLNELKRRQRRRFLFRSTEDEVETAGMVPDESAYTNDHQRLVQMALRQLPPEFRSVLVLRLIDGYSTEETARILGLPQGTVLSRLSRAQKKLRTYLTPFVEERI